MNELKLVGMLCWIADVTWNERNNNKYYISGFKYYINLQKGKI